jgi:predicted TIM-barrel fold metal-dependent hydrolase
MIVDSHQHVCWLDRDDDGLVREMDEHGIDVAWLLTWDMSPSESQPGYDARSSPVSLHPDGKSRGMALNEMIRARDRHPGRFVLGYCPHPGFSQAPDLLRAAREIHGAQVCGEWAHQVLLDDPRAIELFRVAGELAMPVVLDMNDAWLAGKDGKPVYQRHWTGGGLDHLERALQACPGTIFIGHAPGFWRGISADAASDPAQYPSGPVLEPGRVHELLDRYANLRADLSAGSGLGALRRDPAHAKKFLERYSERLLFGRDQYGRALLDFLLGLGLSDAALGKILSGNALGLLAGGGRSAAAPRA